MPLQQVLRLDKPLKSKLLLLIGVRFAMRTGAELSLRNLPVKRKTAATMQTAQVVSP